LGSVLIKSHRTRGRNIGETLAAPQVDLPVVGAALAVLGITAHGGKSGSHAVEADRLRVDHLGGRDGGLVIAVAPKDGGVAVDAVAHRRGKREIEIGGVQETAGIGSFTDGHAVIQNADRITEQEVAVAQTARRHCGNGDRKLLHLARSHRARGN